MKLVIQIPCYNEAPTLPLVFDSLPSAIPGIDELEVQVIDDASTDGTAEVAKALGATRVIRIPGPNRRWLGRAFQTGVNAALEAGADILVNTDGDNQYPSKFIIDLIEPILAGKADIVIGDRNPSQSPEFSRVKRFLQWSGNGVVSALTGLDSQDAVSGFRAYRREALLHLPVLTNYTYTVDTLIQAHAKGFAVVWVKIDTNPPTRESRLIRNIWEKAFRSGLNALRLYTVFAPLRAFSIAALVFLTPAMFLLCRFFYFYLFVPAQAAGHVQSVVVGGAFLVIAALFFLFGMIGELLAVNRILIEQTLSRIRRLESERERG